MADYTDSRRFGTNIYPVESNEVSGLLSRIEPILGPELMKSRYLKGVDLDDYSTEELKDQLNLAMNETELLTGLNLTKVQYRERLPFDRDAYRSFVFLKTNNGPILSVEDLAIESSNGDRVYSLPPEWLELGFAHRRQINLIPILTVFGATGVQNSHTNAGLIFIQAVTQFHWLPGFYTITYTSGVCHKDGHLPIVMNQIVGMTAAIELLSTKQAQMIYSSTSISQDGISQSSAGPGPQTYVKRIEDLTLKREKLLQKVKAEFSQKYFIGTV